MLPPQHARIADQARQASRRICTPAKTKQIQLILYCKRFDNEHVGIFDFLRETDAESATQQVIERARADSGVVEHALLDAECISFDDALRKLGDVGRHWRVGCVELIGSAPGA